MDQFRSFGRKVSLNNTRTAWVLKCDIRKFFASIDQTILMSVVARYISEPDIIGLIHKVVASFHFIQPGKGLPLGNLTSQLLVNIYMNEFDQFAKHTLKAKYYIRYADDFVILSNDRAWLESLVPRIASFLDQRLALTLHPNKVFIETLGSGVDFLGWVHFPDHRVLRTVAKRKMLKRINPNTKIETTRSYLGLLSHGNTAKLQWRHFKV